MTTTDPTAMPQLAPGLSKEISNVGFSLLILLI